MIVLNVSRPGIFSTGHLGVLSHIIDSEIEDIKLC